MDRVSSLSKKFFKAFRALSLYLNDPAHPFAEPKTSELENPPTAAIKLTSLRSSRPLIKSVMWMSFTSKPAKYSA